MKYITAFYSDAGVGKKVSQDSFLCVQASAGKENILFAAVCDGCGGLEKGERASGSVIKRLSDWFSKDLPKLVSRRFPARFTSHHTSHFLPHSSPRFSPELLKRSLKELTDAVHEDIRRSAAAHACESGTTCTAILITGGSYYILNIGDSRICLISEGLFQLTKDHAKGNVLTRCIGAGNDHTPDFFTGTVRKGQNLLLCSDGFTHRIAPSEICRGLGETLPPDRAGMTASLKSLADLCRRRGERDDITAVLIRIV